MLWPTIGVTAVVTVVIVAVTAVVVVRRLRRVRDDVAAMESQVTPLVEQLQSDLEVMATEMARLQGEEPLNGDDPSPAGGHRHADD